MTTHDDLNFNEAFAQARKERLIGGNVNFEWRGKSYHSYTKEDLDVKTIVRPEPKSPQTPQSTEHPAFWFAPEQQSPVQKELDMNSDSSSVPFKEIEIPSKTVHRQPVKNFRNQNYDWATIQPIVSKHFGDITDEARVVLLGSRGESFGENPGLNPYAINRNSPDSIDLGLFQINNKTFQLLRAKYNHALMRYGITDFQDLVDPDKNAFVAKLLYDDSNIKWGNWYGAPARLRERHL